MLLGYVIEYIGLIENIAYVEIRDAHKFLLTALRVGIFKCIFMSFAFQASGCVYLSAWNSHTIWLV